MSTVIPKDEVRRQLQERNDRARERFKQRMIRLFGDFYAEEEFNKWLRSEIGQTKEQI